MGKMFYEGLKVEVNYEKSASFFQGAVNNENGEAYAYFGRQYRMGLGMVGDERKGWNCI